MFLKDGDMFTATVPTSLFPACGDSAAASPSLGGRVASPVTRTVLLSGCSAPGGSPELRDTSASQDIASQRRQPVNAFPSLPLPGPGRRRGLGHLCSLTKSEATERGPTGQCGGCEAETLPAVSAPSKRPLGQASGGFTTAVLLFIAAADKGAGPALAFDL